METRSNNLIYEHKHDGYGWHPKTRIHRKPKTQGVTTMRTCIVCHETAEGMVYDEFLGGFICKKCDMNQEIRRLKR